MTRFVITPEAEADISLILKYLRREAGTGTAERYRALIQTSITRLRTFPDSGAPRRISGAFMRIAVVNPYVLFYEYERGEDLLILLRVLHGKVDINEKLFRR
jgi:plasmid stabilization system protein ParE